LDNQNIDYTLNKDDNTTVSIEVVERKYEKFETENLRSNFVGEIEPEASSNTIEDIQKPNINTDSLLTNDKNIELQFNTINPTNDNTEKVNNPLNMSNYVREAEVIDQIVQKARIQYNGETSEVRIKLKPDFLGEVSLRITMEKGLVVARAVVENNQVKHLLESNLDKLKENFKDQGMMFQRLDVSVGQDSNYRSPNWNFSGNKKRQNFKGTKATAAISELNYSQQTENPYLQNKEGSVDYRA